MGAGKHKNAAFMIVLFNLSAPCLLIRLESCGCAAKVGGRGWCFLNFEWEQIFRLVRQISYKVVRTVGGVNTEHEYSLCYITVLCRLGSCAGDRLVSSQSVALFTWYIFPFVWFMKRFKLPTFGTETGPN